MVQKNDWNIYFIEYINHIQKQKVYIDNNILKLLKVIIMKKLKVILRNTWDECKSKEEKQVFMSYLEKLEATEKTISFDDFIFREHMKLLSTLKSEVSSQ